MSQENVEASRRMWDRFLADDMPGDLAFLDAEIEAPTFGVNRMHASTTGTSGTSIRSKE